ncbi:hypothetical protein ACEQ8H_008565 [Pleosporales sp. CAS-2024a]
MDPLRYQVQTMYLRYTRWLTCPRRERVSIAHKIVWIAHKAVPTDAENIEKERPRPRSSSVPQNYVPLTVIKGAGHEFIPIPEGETAIVADFHSIRTQTSNSPTYLTSGFYRIQAGPTRNIPQYDYEETKYVLSGQIDVLDEATGVMHHLVAGDFAFFHVGSKAQFSSKSGGTAFYAVTRPIITQHPGLKGREEQVRPKL